MHDKGATDHNLLQNSCRASDSAVTHLQVDMKCDNDKDKDNHGDSSNDMQGQSSTEKRTSLVVLCFLLLHLVLCPLQQIYIGIIEEDHAQAFIQDRMYKRIYILQIKSFF